MDGSDEPKDDSTISPLRFLGGGFEFAALCLAGALAGQWIDGRLNSDPWFTVVLLIVAFASGTWLLLRALVTSDRASDSTDGTSPQ